MLSAQEMYDGMIQGKLARVVGNDKGGEAVRYAYAELAKPVEMRQYMGTWSMKAGKDGKTVFSADMKSRTVDAGHTVKIVMVSRLGDFGITDDLNSDFGYHARVSPEDGILINCRYA